MLIGETSIVFVESPLDHKYVYGDEPPITLKSTAPSLPKLQETSTYDLLQCVFQSYQEKILNCKKSAENNQKTLKTVKNTIEMSHLNKSNFKYWQGYLGISIFLTSFK